MNKITGLDKEDIPVLNNILDELDRRIGKIDKATPIPETSYAKFSAKIPISIGGKTYYLMLTQN